MGKTERLAVRTPVGVLQLERGAWGLVAVRFGGRVPRGPVRDLLLERAASELRGYFRGKTQTFDVPLELKGTRFERRVWRALARVPFGATVSYGRLAAAAGVRGARAVGQACARNPIAIVVPCHRVLAADGRLGGYAWGGRVKSRLLAHERRVLGGRSR
jgi:methylated-DNA-[protein]-cysteine S-methyltransferase